MADNITVPVIRIYHENTVGHKTCHFILARSVGACHCGLSNKNIEIILHEVVK